MPTFDFHFKNTMKTCKEDWVPKNWCFWIVVLDKTLESALDCKEIKPVNPKGNLNIYRKDWCWSWSSNTLATLLERPWCWERLKAKAEGEDRGWDGWMASLTQQTWVWANSGGQWSIGKPSHGEAKSWTWLSNWTTTTTVNICMTSGGLWLFKPKWKEDWQVETEELPWRQAYLRLILKTWSLPAPSVWSLKLAMCHSQRKHSSMFLVAVISIHILLVTGPRNVDCFNSWSIWSCMKSCCPSQSVSGSSLSDQILIIPSWTLVIASH